MGMWTLHKHCLMSYVTKKRPRMASPFCPPENRYISYSVKKFFFQIRLNQTHPPAAAWSGEKQIRLLCLIIECAKGSERDTWKWGILSAWPGLAKFPPLWLTFFGNFLTAYVLFKKLLNLLWLIFFMLNWVDFYCCKWPNVWLCFIAIWSHWS